MLNIKYFSPLLIGTIIIVSVILLPIKHKLGPLLITFLAIPITTFIIQGKDSRRYALSGLVIGGISGFILGAGITDAIVNIFFGSAGKYSIRLDLFFGGLIGVTVFSSIGIIVGGWLSRQKKE